MASTCMFYHRGAMQMFFYRPREAVPIVLMHLCISQQSLDFLYCFSVCFSPLWLCPAPMSFPRRLSGSEAPLEGPATSDYPLLKLPRASLSSPSDPFLSHSPSPPTVLPKGKDTWFLNIQRLHAIQSTFTVILIGIIHLSLIWL